MSADASCRDGIGGDLLFGVREILLSSLAEDRGKFL